MAAQKGGREINIFVMTLESSTIPKRDPRAVKVELKAKTEHFRKIENIRYTHTGFIIISTKDIECALNISRLSSFLGIEGSTRII